MKELKPGDIYFRKNHVFGFYHSESLVVKEFTQYRIVRYTACSNNPDYLDIYRLGDGHEQLLCTIANMEPLTTPALGFRFYWMVQSDPWHHMLHKLPALNLKYGESLDGYVEKAIELSEKELEEHFKQVFA